MYRFSTSVISALTAALIALAIAPSTACALPSITPTYSVSPTSGASPATVRAAEARALEIERQLEDLNAEAVSISERIAVTSLRIYLQQREVDQAKQRLDDARTAYGERITALYKGGYAPLELLLASHDFGDFLRGLTWLTRLAEVDRRSFDDAVIEAAEADFEVSQLEDLRAQDVALRQLQDQRIAQSKQLLAEQQQLVAMLDETAKRALAEARRLATEQRQQWLDSSIPITEEVAVSPASVDPYYGQEWSVAYYQPKHYRASGVRYTLVCSWYGNEFHGRATASGQIYNQEDLTCASRTLPFGTRLALQRAGRRVIVVVTDRGPFVSGRDLDLSRAAARLLGFSGVEAVQAEIVTVVQ